MEQGKTQGDAQGDAQSNKIVSIAGGKVGHITPQGEPVKEVVELLEMLLAKARSGEIVGIFFGAYRMQGGVGKADFGWAYRGDSPFNVYSAAHMGTLQFGNVLAGNVKLEPKNGP